MAANEAQLRAECERLMRVNSGLQTEMVMNYVPTADVYQARCATRNRPAEPLPLNTLPGRVPHTFRSLVAILAGGLS